LEEQEILDMEGNEVESLDSDEEKGVRADFEEHLMKTNQKLLQNF